MNKNMITVEQVSKYHPDKYADQISDNIVAHALRINPRARVAVETLVKDTTVVIAGEIGGVDLSCIDFNTAINEIANKLRYKVTNIINMVGFQSEQISKAVIKDDDIGAGDQGIMTGFATMETPTYLPLGMYLANLIISKLETLAENGFIQGDAKCQVTYNKITQKISHVVVSACQMPYDSFVTDFRKFIQQSLSDVVQGINIVVNPAGEWTIGGAEADSGLTGRKIVADQYGPMIPVGGGAFSGKDLTKVDRSAAYGLRNIAIDTLKEFNLEWVFIQCAYQIGKSKPVGLFVGCNNFKLYNDIHDWIIANYDLTPGALINRLNLSPNDYNELSKGCHYRNGYVGNWR
jgi:S-adenosylmethionine synthetase